MVFETPWGSQNRSKIEFESDMERDTLLGSLLEPILIDFWTKNKAHLQEILTGNLIRLTVYARTDFCKTSRAVCLFLHASANCCLQGKDIEKVPKIKSEHYSHMDAVLRGSGFHFALPNTSKSIRFRSLERSENRVGKQMAVPYYPEPGARLRGEPFCILLGW